MVLSGTLLSLNAKAFVNHDAQQYKLALNGLKLKCSQTCTTRLAHSKPLLNLYQITTFAFCDFEEIWTCSVSQIGTPLLVYWFKTIL